MYNHRYSDRTGYYRYRAPFREASSFCDFIPLAISPYFILFYSSKRIFDVLIERSIITYLCPIMIRFNALDFNVCHSEEVISFF